MKLVLHIGTEKTGTTSVQAWLESNRDALSCRGIFLSNVLGRPNNRALAHAFQNDVDPYLLPMGIRTAGDVKAFRTSILRKLANEVKAAAKDHDLMIISSEQFHSRLFFDEEVSKLAHQLKKIFSDVTVVCYLRHQLEMRRSFYSTLVRQGLFVALEDFDNNIDEQSLYYNHEALVRRWEAAFGANQLLLREYMCDKLHRGDVVQDFRAYALPSLDPEGLMALDSAKNATLSALHIEAFRLINRWLPYSIGMGVLSKSNARAKRVLSAALDCVSPLLRTPSFSQRELAIGEGIVSRFSESNRRVSDTYFGGQLFSGLGHDRPSVEGR